MADYPITFPVPKSFDVMDAKLRNAMPRMDRFEYKREPLTSGSLAYHLIDSQWGELGTIKLTKESDTHSTVDIGSPNHPILDMNKPGWKDESEKMLTEIKKRYDDIIGLVGFAMRWELERFERYKKLEDDQEATPAPTTKQAATDATARMALPPVEDPTDKLILQLVEDNPDLTDEQVAAKLPVKNPNGEPFTRQTVNTRRRTLEKMGYKVR